MLGMDHSVAVDFTAAAVRYEKLRARFPAHNLPHAFRYSTNDPAAHNLERLALFALHPATTRACLYAYPTLFLDLIGRWVSSPALFEREYCNAHRTETPEVPGTVILAALSRVLPIFPECAGLVDSYLQTSGVLSRVLAAAAPSPESFTQILLALYRIYRSQPDRSGRFVSSKKLYEILALGDDYAVPRYLAVRILCISLNASEASSDGMVATHVGSLSLEASYDGMTTIDYRFVDLVDAKLLSDYSNYFEVGGDCVPERTSHINSDMLSPAITCVCGVVIPKPRQTQPGPDSAVPTASAARVLRSLAQLYLRRKAVLLHGAAGSGKTFLINQFAAHVACASDIVKIHLGEQTDAKLLTGAYTSGERPGSFEWRTGVLATAVREGKWVLVEDIDKAPTEVLSILLTLLEKRELSIPSRDEIIRAHENFRLFATVRTQPGESGLGLLGIVGLRLWQCIAVETPSKMEIRAILTARFPVLNKLITKFIGVYEAAARMYASSTFVSLNRGSHPRVISIRDLMKFCARCSTMLYDSGVVSADDLLSTAMYEKIFFEAVECFGSALTDAGARDPLAKVIGDILEIAPSRIGHYLANYIPVVHDHEDKIEIGRVLLNKSVNEKALYARKRLGTDASFAKTKHSRRLMEQVGLATQMCEPILLVGETGTGKTTIVQEMAKMMNKKLTVINVSQLTESGDLLGGYKPVNTKTVAIPLQERFESIFLATFSQKKNTRFSELLSKCFNRSQWKNVIKLWKEAIKMADGILAAEEGSDEELAGRAPRKRRKLRDAEKSDLREEWAKFKTQIDGFEAQATNLANAFVFDFVEGSLVKAVRNGEWLLLDEINLASPDTLESIADLLLDDASQRSVLLGEKGDIEPIVAHPDFRIFGCMNPSTDVGKRNLPVSIRSRFTEIYVPSPDKDHDDLTMIVDRYISRYAVGDDWVVEDIAELYLNAKVMAESNRIVDGAGQKPHFSIRTLTRTLVYVRDIVEIYGLRRALFEGFCMAFLTLLNKESEDLLMPLIERYTVAKLKNAKQVLARCVPAPADQERDYVQFKHYWMRKGPGEVSTPNYIITPFVEKNILNLVRATTSRKFPVLLQGPTSAGKTSMIKYLASITGHKFVRINNHEHTDLQEYLGTYVSDASGKLVFQEGVLVEALRKGYWIVLDELNLAPTDVLEALNRLLDDNRELFIPETQETVHPHPDFMIFATQNPPGLYGGRKVLSRAFRNRFLELHFDNIPQDELGIILRERCAIAPSYASKIVEVYRQLSVRRQSSRLFEQKNSFATLRDLFRWAMRDAVGYDQLAANGYMLLAERVRSPEEKQVVKDTLEKVMRVTLDMDAYYELLENKELMRLNTSIVWTKAIRRLAVLVETSIRYKEPLLLVGETGCGKTTICQILAHLLGRHLVTVNAHQNTETGDILGAQRPVRNRFEMRAAAMQSLLGFFAQAHITVPEAFRYDDLVKLFHANKNRVRDSVDAASVTALEEKICNASVLFEWSDGILVQAMRTGDFFLLDEISLAEDSVLERLNSVLEPERSLLLAEKGTEDTFIVAAESFQFLATMNPGGDYGKKELSPALRNRFTEIWVPSMEDPIDVKQIVAARLCDRYASFCCSLVDYSYWFAGMLSNWHTGSGVISLRDILAWVQFVNSCSDALPREVVFLHGALMVFIDALGTNNTAYLSANEETLFAQKVLCVRKLAEMCGLDLVPLYTSKHVRVEITNYGLRAGHFEVPLKNPQAGAGVFNLDAPKTAANAMRVVRAMQGRKPILLEGSPGVGKTSLVAALANAIGYPLVRINLSEQTDLIDLFGSDAPVDGGSTGEFVWKDAPFLRAMKHGEWVLLDEMNLASQSVLEGLNACLDHRGEVYIPELDRSFPCHANFRVFAAQNPQYQGGGRKGLPKSFVNRFSVVYMDMLKTEDLQIISGRLFPSIPADDRDRIISFISQLEHQVVVQKKWGQAGGPWEFNLRDTLRWMGLVHAKNGNVLSQNLDLTDFLDMIVCQRFRTAEDRQHAQTLFAAVFGERTQRDAYYDLGVDYMQAGGSMIARRPVLAYSNQYNDTRLLALQANFRVLESVVRSVNEGIPVILTGPTNAGKTNLIRHLASVVGVKLTEFSMNSDVDSMDILGGYEQVDLTRDMSRVVLKTFEVLNELAVLNTQTDSTDRTLVGQCLALLDFMRDMVVDSDGFVQFVQRLALFVALFSHDQLAALVVQAQAVKEKIQTSTEVTFRWFDGMLVRAVSRGDWLVLDNANLCNPSVLDRLNSLLETNRSLLINECSQGDGSARVLTPHPDFRLFLTVNPKYGELSRAMRNRCIEVYMDDLETRGSQFDRQCLEPGARPPSYFLSATDSSVRVLAAIHDTVGQSSAVLPSALAAILSGNSLYLVASWCSSMALSRKYEMDLQETTRQVQQHLAQAGYAARLGGIYRAIPQSLLNNQILHFHWNEYLLPVLSDAAQQVSSAEVTVLFEVAVRILQARNMLAHVETRALKASVHELSFLETSAALSLNRAIRKPPKVQVYAYVRAVAQFVEEVFLRSLEPDFFLAAPVYASLLEIQCMWTCLVNSTRTQKLSHLRVYLQMCSEWLAKNASLALVQRSASMITALDVGMNLTSGFSMVRIWKAFRQKYPASAAAWENYALLCALFLEFDAIVPRLHADAHEEAATLRELLMRLHNDFVAGTVLTDELEQLFAVMGRTIQRLADLSGSLVIERENRLVAEYTHVHNILESAAYFCRVESQALFRLAQYTTKSTMSLVNASRNIMLAPYPRLFDSLWTDGDAVTPLFTNTLVTATLDKTVDMRNCPGKFLDQGLSDMTALRDVLAEHSEHLLDAADARFARILEQWTREVLAAHGIAGVTLPDAEMLALVEKNCEPAAAAVIKAYLCPVLHIFGQSPTVGQLGRAWILFSTGCIQLFVPSSLLDPAIEEHVKTTVLGEVRDSFEQIVQSWEHVRLVLSGDEPVSLERNGPAVPEKSAAKCEVFRNLESIDPLFDECNAFMESDMGPEPMAKLLEAAENLHATINVLRVRVFEKNTDAFLQRLRSKFGIYADLNEILSGFVYGAKLGLQLMMIQQRQDSTHVALLCSWGLEVSNVLNHESIERTFDAIKLVTKSLDNSSVLCEKLMHFFINVCFFNSHASLESVLTVTTEAFQTLYYRWYYRKLKAEESEAKEGAIYRHKHDDDADHDFRELFPDFDEVMTLSSDHLQPNDGFDDAYYAIAESYVQFYLAREQYSLASLIEQGVQLSSELRAQRPDLVEGQSNSSQLAALLHMMTQLQTSFSTEPDRAASFYNDANTYEYARAMKLILALYGTVSGLLRQWPEHATLQNIHLAADEFLSYPSSFPVNRLLHKVEVIFGLVTEWQKFASSQVSLKDHLDALAQLIVSWRRLELLSWKSIFQQEELTVKKSIGKWWYHLFETIVIPLYRHDKDELPQSPTMILSALNVFMGEAKLGEFESRLDLLKAFRNHARGVASYATSIVNGLSNLITFYDLFVPQINEHILQTRKTLEKDVAEVILLASWKDVNIDVLKQSSRKSHSSLYKLVRKYRALLATPVTFMIEKGYAGEPAAVRELPILAAAYVTRLRDEKLQILSLCQQSDAWQQRPAPLRNMDTIENNMRVYTERIAAHEHPSIYEYAQSVVSEMERLRRDTPSMLNDANKREVAALKTQKHKLLSDTLKELRRMGVSTNVRPNVHKALATVNSILVHSASFFATALEGTDADFFRILELWPRLRAAVTNGHEDVPQADLERGMAASENLLFSLVATRTPMVELAQSISTIDRICSSLEALATTDSDIARASVVCSLENNERQIDGYLRDLMKLLDYAIHLLDSLPQARNSGIIKVLSDAYAECSTIQSSLPSSDARVHTVDKLAVVAAVAEYLSRLQLDLAAMVQAEPQNGFLGLLVLDWMHAINYHPFVGSCMSLVSLCAVDDLEKSLIRLSNNALLAVQQILELQKDAISDDDDAWFASSQKQLAKTLMLLRHANFALLLTSSQEVLYLIEHNSQSSRVAKAMLAFTMPVISYHRRLCHAVLARASSNYGAVSKTTYILAKSLHTLASDGFCSPELPSHQKNDDNLHEGTGLGDGEGATNHSKGEEEDDDLAEHAQQPNEEKNDDENDGDSDDAVEMSGDMAGNLENMSDQDGSDNENQEEQDLDEEIDDLDDLDPNAIDEKMWDQKASENEKERDLDKMPDSAVQDDQDMDANEDEASEHPKDHKDSKDGDDGDEEEDDVAEQEDEVKNEKGEAMDTHVPEAEALELPEDLNLESGLDDENGEDNLNEGKDIDGESADDADDDSKDAKDDINDDVGDDGDDWGSEDNENGENECEEPDPMAGETAPEVAEAQEQELDNDTADDIDMEENDEVGQNMEKDAVDEKDAEQTNDEAALGEQGGEDADDDVDMDAAVKTDAGTQGEGADELVTQEQNDVGASGETAADTKDEPQDSPNQDVAQDQMKDTMKQLGDSLKEFHRRRNEIKETSSKSEQQKQEEQVNVKPDEFQHVDGESAKHDTQALGAADNKDQVQSIDEDLAIDDDEPEPVVKDEKPVKAETDDMVVDEAGEPEDANDADDFDAKTQGGVVGERKNADDETVGAFHGEMDFAEPEQHDTEDIPLETYQIAPDEVPYLDIDTARSLWKNSELVTQELASVLCEQLRLILEPTLATKLRGDYKTGKRLNMKRIISYIASDFRKDKIWLRRTKPAKREYQIMIAVDDSKSMSESGSTELALHSIALVSKALTQLESGGLSIVRFGEDVKLVHPFDRPFNQEVGANVFRWFDFKQEKTDIKQLCSKSLKIFEDARSSSNADLWQMQIIISDGVCEDHQTVMRLVRKAREEKVMLVFVIVDGISSKESILDMSQVSYVPDPTTGAMTLKVNNYLDTFPFEFYVVVKNIRELPEMLSLILRQYFSEVANV